MAIVSGDLRFHLTGGAANADPALSLGGVISSVQLVDATLENLFDNVSPADALAGAVHYRALSFKNASAETAWGAVVFISQETTSADTTVAIAYDSTGTQSVVDEDTAPTGLTFSTPLSLSAGIALGDVAAGGVRRVWFKRITNAGAAQASDSGKITITVGSAP
jgi:hypothetical protein